MVYETIVCRQTGGVSGSFVVDVEAGFCRWQSDDLAGDSADILGGDGGGCGCLTWEGAQVLPLRVEREELIGAVPTTGSSSSSDDYYPGFEVVYARKIPVKGPDGSKRQIVRTDPFLCTNSGQTEECIAKLRTASGCSGGGRKRALVILNPVSGPGKGRKHWERDVKPALEASGLPYTFKVTQASGDAKKMATDLDLDVFDTVVLLGGDGTLHEVIQGLFSREDSERARQVALGTIPTGSGNGFAASVGFRDVDTALYAILKNRRSPMDLVSILQPATAHRWFMCLTATFGFIADLDLNTEHLRWMGQGRFTAGAVYEILRGRTTNARVAFMPKSSYQGETKEQLAYSGDGTVSCTLLSSLTDKDSDSLFERLPQPWRVVEYENFQLFVCSNVQCMSMGDIVAPTVSASSGSLALITTPERSRFTNIKLMDAVQYGTTHEASYIDYQEVMAFIIEPKCDRFQYSLDGERIPKHRIFGELHAGLGTCFTNG